MSEFLSAIQLLYTTVHTCVTVHACYTLNLLSGNVVVLELWNVIVVITDKHSCTNCTIPELPDVWREETEHDHGHVHYPQDPVKITSIAILQYTDLH